MTYQFAMKNWDLPDDIIETIFLVKPDPGYIERHNERMAHVRLQIWFKTYGGNCHKGVQNFKPSKTKTLTMERFKGDVELQYMIGMCGIDEITPPTVVRDLNIVFGQLFPHQ